MRWVLASFCFCACPSIAQELAPTVSEAPPDVTTIEVPGAKSPAPTESTLGLRDTLRVTNAEYQICLSELDKYDVKYSEIEPVISDDDVDCGVLRPLEIAEIAPGVLIEPSAIVRCETALSLARWTHDFVLPAAKRLEDRGVLTVLENGSAYTCRRRNNTTDGRLSEHGLGNAFDVMGFQFDDGSRIAVEPRESDGTLEEAFQDAVRAAACLDFSTVLGPGSNASHADHLHLDIISRNSGYRICEQGGAVTE